LRTLISGGLGLVGVNYSSHRLKRGDRVCVLDNGTRGKSNQVNAEWLRGHPEASNLVLYNGDVTKMSDIETAVDLLGGVDVMIHAAAQSSVNKSMEDPRLDFEANVVGTFNVLEFLRQQYPRARFVFMASNKIYETSLWSVDKHETRYSWADRQGPSDDMPFYTDAREPYGASKISGFYYSRCYAVMYNMPVSIVVPSGMTGERQYGRMEQGWVGWFSIATLLGLPLTVLGDGLQVRDLVHTDDVCVALDLVVDLAAKYPGEVYNLGGGLDNSISLKEALVIIEDELGLKAIVTYEAWRPQDNKVYVSNIDKLQRFGWKPGVVVEQTIRRVCRWVKANRGVLERLYGKP